MIEKLQTKLVEATELVRDFEFELAQAKENIDQALNNETASAVSIAEIKLAAAKKNLSKAKAELDQEKARVNSSGYTAAVKRLAEIEKEAAKRFDIVLAKVDELYKAIDDIDELAKEQYRLRSGYKISGIRLNEKADYRHLIFLQSKLLRWRRDWKARKAPPAIDIPTKHNYTKEQERAIKDRYKPATELNAKLARQWAKEHPGDDDLD